MNNQAVNCDSPVFNQSLMSVDEALEFLLDASVTTEKKESVSLDDSLGRILACDIHSTITFQALTTAPWMAMQLRLVIINYYRTI